jgi:hypothetical protein
MSDRTIHEIPIEQAGAAVGHRLDRGVSRLDARELESNRHFWPMLEQEPATCIVDGLPQGEEVLQRLKGLITNGETVVHRKNQEPKRVRSPNFIFCTSDPEPLKHLEGRRFRVIRMGTAG